MIKTITFSTIILITIIIIIIIIIVIDSLPFMYKMHKEERKRDEEKRSAPISLPERLMHPDKQVYFDTGAELNLLENGQLTMTQRR